MPLITPAETDQLIKEIITGAQFANGNPRVGDWVEDLYLLSEVLVEEELN
jgi:hypothetical protein